MSVDFNEWCLFALAPIALEVRRKFVLRPNSCQAVHACSLLAFAEQQMLAQRLDDFDMLLYLHLVVFTSWEGSDDKYVFGDHTKSWCMTVSWHTAGLV